MRPFQFRAQSVLDLRRKLEDDARIALSRAEASLLAARACAEAADRALIDDGERLAGVQRDGAPGWLIGWHRSWIVRRQSDAAACRRRVTHEEAAVARAADIVRDAHRKRRILERLRERAWRRYETELRRQDARDMNALAGLRYLARAADQGGHDGDDRPHDSHDDRDRYG